MSGSSALTLALMAFAAGRLTITKPQRRCAVLACASYDLWALGLAGWLGLVCWAFWGTVAVIQVAAWKRSHEPS